MSTLQPADIAADIESLIGRITAAGGSSAAEAQELVRLLMAYYGAGLSRILDLMRADAAHAALLERLTRDPFVGSLLTLHNLQPPPSPPLIQITHSRRERCELCETPLTNGHAHVLDLETRRLLCSCPLCGGAEGRYRVIPSRYVHTPAMRLTAAQWDMFGIPVGLAYFVFDSRRACAVASYPGPAGATESLLPRGVWPPPDASWLLDVSPDVEAVLARRRDDHYLCYVIPLDACYELVGRIRRNWTGFSGGPTAQIEIDRFFAEIAQRASAASQVCA